MLLLVISKGRVYVQINLNEFAVFSPMCRYRGSLNFKKTSRAIAVDMSSPLNEIYFIFEFLFNLKLGVD
jgi:hypothetical protein